MKITENMFAVDQIEQLEITRTGLVIPRLRSLDYDTTLKGSLLPLLYPGIRVASVLVPVEPLDEVQESLVRATMSGFTYKGIRYRLVGAASSAKNGLVYFVDEDHHQLIAKRFQQTPQFAITYFGILVSNCTRLAKLPAAKILVVKDGEFGTNDCGGYIEESIALSDLDLLPGSFSQFRIASGNKQAKGSLKIMDKAVADLLGADIVLPRSCLKPGLTRLDKVRHAFGNLLEGETFIGIREIARPFEFEPSYTLTQHAPPHSIITEILPQTKDQAERVSQSVAEGNYQELLRLIGHNSEEFKKEVGPVEGLLLADTTGHIVRHPWVYAQLDKLLTRYQFKTRTAGAYLLPAFALSHDGYLTAHEGKVYHGSDWIPKDHAICGLKAQRGLCVRYPIRMYADLLPVKHLSPENLLSRLRGELEKQGCPEAPSLAERIAVNQLEMEGTYTLHSEVAALNGGDFDFDLVGVIAEDRFPAWVADRFAYTKTIQITKNKTKAQHPWWNIVHVARKATGGNQIGVITDLMTSCSADGRPDLAELLVQQLQNALDSLKHAVEPDQEVIASIRKQVTRAPWLALKNLKRVSDLPSHLEVKETDTIGILYNHVSSHFDKLLPEPLPLEAFVGLIQGEQVTEKMIAECHHHHRAYGAVVAAMAKRKAGLIEAAAKAWAEWDEVRNVPDKNVQKQKRFAHRQAQAALHFDGERAKDEMKAIVSVLKIWAQDKTQRMAWAQALNTIVCGVKSKGTFKPTGSLIYITFPQEVATRLAELCEGEAVCLYKPKMIEAFVRTDEHGRTFIVEAIKGQLKETFVYACRNGEFTVDAALPVAESKKQEEQKAASQTQPIEDPAGLGHEIVDDVVFQVEYGSMEEANMKLVPF